MVSVFGELQAAILLQLFHLKPEIIIKQHGKTAITILIIIT